MKGHAGQGAAGCHGPDIDMACFLQYIAMNCALIGISFVTDPECWKRASTQDLIYTLLFRCLFNTNSYGTRVFTVPKFCCLWHPMKSNFPNYGISSVAMLTPNKWHGHSELAGRQEDITSKMGKSPSRLTPICTYWGGPGQIHILAS